VVNVGSLRVEVLKRLVTAVIAFFVILTVIFWAFRVAPDDSHRALLGRGMHGVDDALVDDMSLGEPLIVQYIDYLGDTLRGDLYSYYGYGSVPVADIALEAAEVTMILFAVSLVLSCLVGACFERFIAGPTGSLRDRLSRVLAVLAWSAQVSGLAMLIVYCDVRVGSPLPNSMRPFGLWLADLGGLGDALISLVLPVASIVCVTSPFFWLILRHGRTACGSAGKAEGVTAVFGRLRATGPMPLFFVSWVMLSTLAVEPLFAARGLGYVMFFAVSNADLVVLMGCVLVVALLTLAVVTVTDLLLLLAPAAAESVAEAAIVPRSDRPRPLSLAICAVRRAWSGVRRSRAALASFAVLAAFVAIAVLAPVLSMVDGDPSTNLTPDVLLDPSLTPSPETGLIHLLGTDHLGRDLYSLMLYGARGPLVLVAFLALSTFLVACALGVLAAMAARLPARVTAAAYVPLRGVTYAFAAVSCVLIMYQLIGICGMDLLSYSVAFAFMYMAWAWEVVVVPAHRLSRASIAAGTSGLWSLIQGSLRVVVPRSLRAAKTATVVGFLVVTMIITPATLMIHSWPAPSPTWGHMMDDAATSSALLAGPQLYFIVPFVLLTLLGASAYILMDRLEAVAEGRREG